MPHGLRGDAVAELIARLRLAARDADAFSVERDREPQRGVRDIADRAPRHYASAGPGSRLRRGVREAVCVYTSPTPAMTWTRTALFESLGTSTTLPIVLSGPHDPTAFGVGLTGAVGSRRRPLHGRASSRGPCRSPRSSRSARGSETRRLRRGPRESPERGASDRRTRSSSEPRPRFEHRTSS